MAGHFSRRRRRELARSARLPRAADALSKLDAGEDIDAVPSDIVMPEVNGFALAEEIARRYPRLPIMLATGYSGLEQAPDTARPILRKPFDLAALDEALRAAAAA